MDLYLGMNESQIEDFHILYGTMQTPYELAIAWANVRRAMEVLTKRVMVSPTPMRTMPFAISTIGRKVEYV